MKMLIYGLPCAGKSTLISKIDFASHIDGSAGDIAIEKHFSFPSEEGYSITSSDNVSDSYDAVAYLDTAPDIILERMKQSEDYNRYSDLTEEDLVSWRDYEVTNLRSECFSKGKEFIILDPKFDKILGFLKGIFKGSILTSPQVAKLAADRILQSTDKHTIILSDGEGTAEGPDGEDGFGLHHH